MSRFTHLAKQSQVALVTGASGFAGRHLIQALLDTTTWQIVGLEHEKQSAISSARYSAWRVDLLNRQDLVRALKAVPPDLIFHLAAALPPHDDERILQVNVGGAINLLEAVVLACPKTSVLIVGSDSQYGPQRLANLPTAESAAMRPLHVYGRSKLLQERIALSYQQMRGIRLVCVRPFNYIGPGQSEGFVVSSIAHQIALAEQGRGSGVIEMGRMDSRRDFTDVRDVVNGFFLALTRGRSGAVYNIGSGISFSIRDIAERLAFMAKVPITFCSVAQRLRDGDVDATQCDATRLKRRTGWIPEIAMQQTLQDTLEDWRVRTGSDIQSQLGSTR